MSDEALGVIDNYLGLVRSHLPETIADEVINEMRSYIIDTAQELGQGRLTIRSAKRAVARFGAPSEVASEYASSMMMARAEAPPTKTSVLTDESPPFEPGQVSVTETVSSLPQPAVRLEVKEPEPRETVPGYPQRLQSAFIGSMFLAFLWAGIAWSATIVLFGPMQEFFGFIFQAVPVTLFLLVLAFLSKRTGFRHAPTENWRFRVLIDLPRVSDLVSDRHARLLLNADIAISGCIAITLGISAAGTADAVLFVFLIATSLSTIWRMVVSRKRIRAAHSSSIIVEEFVANLLTLILCNLIFQTGRFYTSLTPTPMPVGAFVLPAFVYGPYLLYSLVIGTPRPRYVAKRELLVTKQPQLSETTQSQSRQTQQQQAESVRVTAQGAHKRSQAHREAVARAMSLTVFWDIMSWVPCFLLVQSSLIGPIPVLVLVQISAAVGVFLIVFREPLLSGGIPYDSTYQELSAFQKFLTLPSRIFYEPSESITLVDAAASITGAAGLAVGLVHSYNPLLSLFMGSPLVLLLLLRFWYGLKRAASEDTALYARHEFAVNVLTLIMLNLTFTMAYTSVYLLYVPGNIVFGFYAVPMSAYLLFVLVVRGQDLWWHVQVPARKMLEEASKRAREVEAAHIAKYVKQAWAACTVHLAVWLWVAVFIIPLCTANVAAILGHSLQGVGVTYIFSFLLSFAALVTLPVAAVWSPYFAVRYCLVRFRGWRRVIGRRTRGEAFLDCAASAAVIAFLFYVVFPAMFLVDGTPDSSVRSLLLLCSLSLLMPGLILRVAADMANLSASQERLSLRLMVGSGRCLLAGFGIVIGLVSITAGYSYWSGYVLFAVIGSPMLLPAFQMATSRQKLIMAAQIAKQARDEQVSTASLSAEPQRHEPGQSIQAGGGQDAPEARLSERDFRMRFRKAIAHGLLWAVLIWLSSLVIITVAANDYSMQSLFIADIALFTVLLAIVEAIAFWAYFTGRRFIVFSGEGHGVFGQRSRFESLLDAAFFVFLLLNVGYGLMSSYMWMDSLRDLWTTLMLLLGVGIVLRVVADAIDLKKPGKSSAMFLIVASAIPLLASVAGLVPMILIRLAGSDPWGLFLVTVVPSGFVVFQASTSWMKLNDVIHRQRFLGRK